MERNPSMNRFTVVEGKHSFLYNHFKEYNFSSCVATDTRLMGVVAMKMTWISKTSRFRICQIIHLDFSEYGIDDYMEYLSAPAYRSFSPISSASELKDQWERVSGSLGGKEIEISLGAAVQLIEMALNTNQKYYRYHEADVQEFREHTIARIHLMIEAAKEDASYIACSPLSATKAVCLPSLTPSETMNYFLMRMCDMDYTGAAVLSTLEAEALSHIAGWKYSMMTMIHNQIRKGNAANTYYCTTLTQDDKGYLYARVTLTLDTSGGRKAAKVSSIECNCFQRISEAEMAMHMKHPEYITVYDINCDIEDLDLDMSPMVSGSQMSAVPNGILYLRYNESNAHVNSNNYFMNNDVYGAYLITPQGQLVLMSPEIMKISTMELDIASHYFMNELKLSGRYKFDTQVFQTFCELPGTRFEDILQ